MADFFLIIVVLIALSSNEEDPPSKQIAQTEQQPENQPEQEVKPVAEPALAKKTMFNKYSMLREKDHSFGNRVRIIIDVKAPEAKTDRESIEAMMSAIVKRHRKDWPHVVSVFLRHSDELDTVAKNRVTYALDGCGWAGDGCTGEIWTELMEGEMPGDLTGWGKPTKAGKELACRNDLQCWGDKYSFSASSVCAPLIESMAQYTHEWTDGWLGAKFDRFMWKDRKGGTVAYFGNKIKFQNGFGAWQNMSYQCDYNPGTKTAKVEAY